MDLFSWILFIVIKEFVCKNKNVQHKKGNKYEQFRLCITVFIIDFDTNDYYRCNLQ